MGAVRFQVNAPDVMHETIDGEVIAINLVTGNYYSLRGTGATVWSLVSESGPVSSRDVAGALSHRFTTERAEIEAGVERFLAELSDEGLVANGETETTQSQPPALASVPDAPRVAFDAPTLERYTDMQDLVLLDPVHQVDQAGWPRTQADTERDDDAARRTA